MFRRAQSDDIRTLAELWARAFPGERTVEQRIRQLETGGVFGGIEAAWLAHIDGRLAGAFRAYSLTQHMHGAVYPLMGLAAVAVDETARRRGVGRALCLEAIRVARERGDVLSALYPFRPAFYHALGWAHVGEMHAYRFRPESLPRRSDVAVTLANSDDLNGIAGCYARVARETNGMIARTPRIWRQHFDYEGTHAYRVGAARIEGYIIVRHGRGSAPDERVLFVHELIAEHAAAYDALLSWIADQRDAWRLIRYDAAPDEHFDHRLSDPRPPGFRSERSLWTPTYRAIRGPMLRVLDVAAAIERRVHWGSAPPLRFGVDIADDVVAENSGPVTVDFDGSRAVVARGGTARPSLRTDVQTFAQIFAGELLVTEAISLGAAEVDGDAATLNAVFRVDRCFRLLDEF